MSYDNPINCRNCDELIYWDKSDPSKRPYDADTEDYHRCSASPYKPTQSTPKLIQCKNGCGIQIVYDVTEGYYREGSLTGKKHFPCPMFGKNNKEQQQQINTPTPPPPSKVKEVIMTGNAPRPQQQPARQLEDLVRETNLILQGIASQLQRLLDTAEVSSRYQKATKDILQEYKEEVIDSIKNPKVSFENGRDPTTINIDDEPDNDIYDEIADTDDSSTEDLGGFKPSDTGNNKGV